LNDQDLLFEELVFPIALVFLPYMMRKEGRKEGRGPGKSFSSKTASHSGLKILEHKSANMDSKGSLFH
jgi:hypothetical protein